MQMILFIAGLALLIVGAEFLVRGASHLAAALGVPSLIIGLTVVAFGTSAPELAVGFKSALAGQESIAVGNVIGSNIFNVLLILGVSALICPLFVSQQLIRFDVPLMIAASVAALLVAWNGTISRFEGVLLSGTLLAYITFLIYYGRNSSQLETGLTEQKPPGRPRSWLGNGVMIAIGLSCLVLGSRWLVDSAVSLAEMLGVGQLVIGLTIVAAGTSLPEVVTSIVASLRGERDIAVGNVVGSNLFNILGVLGLSALVSPSGIDVTSSVVSFDIPIMIAVAFACLPIFFTGGVISRWEGGLLFGYYVAYTIYLVLAATQHAALPAFSSAMIYFVMPMTVVTLFVVTAQAIRQKANVPKKPNGA